MTEYTKLEQVSQAVAGKVVVSIEGYDNSGNDYLEIHFTDGSSFRLRYDWIYTYEVIESEGNEDG